jgi:hypothetical protein
LRRFWFSSETFWQARMMRLAAYRDHRLDPRRRACVHISFAEVSIIRKQGFGFAKFVWQIAKLFQHRLKLLLVIRRLRQVGGQHQQAARRHAAIAASRASRLAHSSGTDMPSGTSAWSAACARVSEAARSP